MEPALLLTIFFLFTALTLYAVFGGADFGGGVLEATLSRYAHLQRKIEDTLAPIWEANHVWLIAVVVICFVGFPLFYTQLLTVLFVPVCLMLLGIILRGAFFTFRKYDPEPAKRRKFYSVLFRASSALTPAMFGFIIAALLQPLPKAGEGPISFADMYIHPWLTWHGLLTAVFVSALFGYTASVFLFGEVQKAEDRAVIRTRIYGFFLATFLLGGAVLLSGAALGLVEWSKALDIKHALIFGAATLAIPVLMYFIRREWTWPMRLVAGFHVACIIGGWFLTHFPVLLRYKDGSVLTFKDAAAPSITIFWLNVGLTIVLAIVAPFLVYLYKVFAAHEAARGPESEAAI